VSSGTVLAMVRAQMMILVMRRFRSRRR
jgi:hypothetical protein